MRKFLTFFLTALLAFGVGWAGEVTDEITWSGFGIQSISYSSFSNVSFSSGALYSGRVAAKASGGPIQINASASSQNGIFTTQSGGKVKSVTVTFNSATNSGNYVDIYGKNTAYSQISDLYTSSEQGTVIASPRMADSNLTQSFDITDDYDFIAIRSRTKAVYIDKITIVWETGSGPTVAAPTFSYDNATVTNNVEVNKGDIITISSGEGTMITYTTDGSDPAESTTAITTDGNTANVEITENCTIKAIALDEDANMSNVATLNVTAKIPPTTFTLVTNIRQLAPGKKIIFVDGNEETDFLDTNYAMSSTQNGNNRGAAEVMITESKTVVSTDNTEILTLEQTEDGDYWYFLAAKYPGYLYAAGANSNNYLRTEATKDTKAQATIEIATDGEATVKFNAGTRNLLSYNTSSKLFSCYATEQAPVYIYIDDPSASTPEPEPVACELSYGEEAVVKTATVGDETFEEPTLINPHSVSPITYTSRYTDVATVNESGEVTIVGAGQTTITATFAGNDEYLAGEASYTINVAKKTMGLAFEPTSTQAYVGQDVTEPELKNLPEGDEYTVAYSSNNAAVATVEASTGEVTAVAPGEATITAKFAGNNVYEADSASYTITVLAKKAAGLSYGEEAVVINAKVGDAIEEPELANPNDLTVTYESSDTTVAKVDNAGNVTIVGAGTATITAKSEATTEYLAGEASYTIKVTKKDASVTFSEHAYTVYVGNDFTAPTPATDPEGLDVSYSIKGDVDAVLFDDTDGTVVIGDVPGTVTITATFAGNATYNEASDSYTITIKEKEVATLSFNVEGITVYPNAENFNQPVLTTTPAGLDVTYTSTDDDIATVVDGKLVIGEKIGTATITAKFNGNDTYGEATASYTVTVEPRPIVVADDAVEFALYVGETESQAIDLTGENLKGDITLTLNDETGFFTIDPTTITKDDAENATVTVTYAPTTEGTHEATVTISTPDALENVTVTLTGIAVVRPVVATPTFSPVPGSYTSAQTVTINCATQGATIKYSTDGGNNWAEGNTVNVDKDMTIQVMAEKDGMTASSATATYVIDIPAEKPTMEPIDGYFKVMNNGNQKFVNVAGRKTITFANEANIDKMAGTVVYLKTDEHGQVQSLRSQAADLQGYADRAMRYVPEIVQMAVDKLHAEGTGEILGNEGLDAIMAKFDECFDHHLYVEAAEGGYRLYGKTPSMQHVVDFYRENQEKVDAKLPQLEAFINSAIEKVLEKTGGRGASILQPFSLRETWQRMGGTLTEPVDEASTMAFYREVLNNKNYVWDFAYETAMTYWERLKNNQTFIDNKDKLGEFAQYIDKIEDVRPDFKYYIVQDNNQIDYISEGNVDIINTLPRTVWTLTPRDKFTVNFDSNMTMDDRLYYTTLYTDFAYSMPEGVKAYKVTEVNNNGVGAIEALEGTIPAQTPVLLKSNAAGDVELTIAAAGNADVTGNLLVGADYFINTYEIKTPQVEGMFNMVATVFGENSSFYQELLNKYGYLMIKTSGTVNNKYFWALTNDDLTECVVENELGEEDCVVRTLGKDEDGIGFYSEWTAPINQAFLASDKFNPVKLLLGKDVTRDGLWNVVDVTATISIILGTAPENNNYDYDAADFDNSGRINVADVTAMIAYILGK